MAQTFRAKVISNHRITIDRLARHLLQIREGDILTVTITKEASP